MKKVKTKKAKRPQDATLRNVRAAKKREKSLREQIAIIEKRIKEIYKHLCIESLYR